MAYQSLYRRYRPRTFAEVRAQEHLVTALRNAVRDDRVGHAYLFSGPRGTGKTSTARILAKALNCPDVTDGEPCGVCESCIAIDAGTSFDVHELDAASNNGVNEVRDLISKIALGTPGRTKVYILDEVHMLTAGASNALLKTLEEPPDHVVFVLATTDPQKVLPTIKSRTQHYEVHLHSADELRSLVEDIVADAGLDVSAEAIEHVVRAGKGSARDALSALEQVAAAGGVDSDIEHIDELVEALCEQDTGRALITLEQAVTSGRSPRLLGELLIGRLRDVFLASMRADLSRLSDRDQARVADQARRLGAAAVTRAIETLGEVFMGINDAPDPRIPLEVAIVRLTKPEIDTGTGALVARIERLERALADGVPAAQATPRPSPAAAGGGTDEAPEPAGEPSGDSAGRPVDDASPAPSKGEGAAAGARAALASTRGGADDRTPPPRPGRPARPAPTRRPAGGADADRPDPSTPSSADAEPAADRADEEAAPGRSAAPPAPAAPPATPPAGGGTPPARHELESAWNDAVLSALPVKAKSRFSAGHWLDSSADAAVFGLPNQRALERCADAQDLVERALADRFGRPVRVQLALSDAAPTPSVAGGPADPGGVPRGPAPVDDDEAFDPDDLVDAPDAASSTAERITTVFAGAELVTDE